MVVKAGPFAVDAAALNVASHYKHAVGVAVVGAAIAVFLGGAAELAHGDYDDVAHVVSHVLLKRGKRLA